MRKLILPLLLCALVGGGILPAQADETPVSLCADLQDPAKIPPEFSFIQDMQAGADGWIFSRRDVGKVASLRPETQDSLKRLAYGLKRQGTQLVMILVPNRILLAANKATPETLKAAQYVPVKSEAAFHERLVQLRRLHIMAPDVLESLQDSPLPGVFFFRRDHHWTPLGAERTAAVVADALLGVPEFRSLKPASPPFMSVEVGTEPYAGYYARLIRSVCHTDVPDETLPLYKSQGQGGNTGASLLDDAPRPSVVLVGTSLSNNEGRDRFNFVGFLRQYLKQDVLNAAVAGGGSGSSMLAWLSNGTQVDKQPGFLLWEMPGEYDLNISRLYRQLVPTITGMCQGTDMIAEKTVSLPGGETSLLTVPPGIVAKGGLDYVALETGDRSLNQFVLSFAYGDGRVEAFPIDSSTRARWTGRTFVELAPVYGDDLRDIRITTEGPSREPISARLCRGLPLPRDY